MKKLAIGFAAALIVLLSAAAPAGTQHDADKLPKCSRPLCEASGCSADTLCAKGAAVVTCADICHSN